MQRKIVVSGPVRGPLQEGHVERPSRAVPRQGLIMGRVGGTKMPPPVEGWKAANAARRA